MTSAPATLSPRTDWMSSSLAMTTSMLDIIDRITACAAASVHNFLRKFRSTLTRAPARRAAVSASMVQATALAPSAGVIPVKWNHDAPLKTAGQSIVPGVISLIAECARS